MLWHDAFYRFVTIEHTNALKETLESVCGDAGVMGSILVAHEGINGMLAGTEEQLQKVKDWLEADPRFTGMMMKRTPCDTMPFRRFRVRLKKEIVPLGLPHVDATSKTGINVSPKEWRELIKREDVVVIDNRNSFEYQHGHFKNAIDPGVLYFRHFANYMENHLPTWQAEDKTIAMYCTGGIRCEKTTAWLAEKGIEVYQLEGGILNYFKEIPDADQDYEGDCYIFDDRKLLDTKLRPKAFKPGDTFLNREDL
ncbi:MAG: rhodanese-related sulfurtransferase [Trueperaceae bacterium]